MRISLVITEGAKQVMLTPETPHEKEALKMIAPDDTLKVVGRMGAFADKIEHVHYQVAKSKAGYYRVFETRDSLMFVIEPDDSKDDGTK